MFKYLKAYFYLRKKRKGKVRDRFLRYGDGYYSEDIGSRETFKIDGREGVCEIFDLNEIDDFGSENIQWDFIGYVNEKSVRECTVRELIRIYSNRIK